MNTDPRKSAQPCGCDEGCGGYLCERHRSDAGTSQPCEAPALIAPSFVVKDSGVREQFSSGMVRDTAMGKTDFSLILDGPMFDRWAIHLTKGTVKYAKRNWMLAAGQAELDRFRESGLRHFLQWYRDEVDEDHASAVYFNINGAEYVKGRL